MVLIEIEGCFVCFVGNIFLIGKINDVYFIFDFYLRIIWGLFSLNGKSIRFLFKSVDDFFMYIQIFVRLMGFLDVVECNLIGVNCCLVLMEIVNKVLKIDENLIENN